MDDLKKAFDSVYKKWQVAALQLIKTPKWIVRYIEQAGSKWKTSINLQVNRKTHKSSEVPIEKGIFQGDTLSPLLFVVSIIPVSLLINRMNLGYMFGAPKQRKLDKIITHLLFMDDMKIYTTSKQSLVKVFNRAAEIFQSMGLFVGPDKCAVQHIVHGKKILDGLPIMLQSGEVIQYLEHGKGYSYLRFPQEEQVKHDEIFKNC